MVIIDPHLCNRHGIRVIRRSEVVVRTMTLCCVGVLALAITGCGELEPIVEPEIVDLQLTMDTLRTQVRETQRNLAEVRAELEAAGAKVVGPIPLPTRINKWTVQRSTHADKKSREQFEIRTHKRLMDIMEPTPETMDALMKLNLAAGVDVEIKL